MIYVAHNSNYRRTGFEILFIIFFNFFFHFHLLLHIDKLHIESKLTGHQFYYFCIQTLINRYHNTKTHTLADNFGKTYIHQVSQLTNTDKFSNL